MTCSCMSSAYLADGIEISISSYVMVPKAYSQDYSCYIFNDLVVVDFGVTLYP